MHTVTHVYVDCNLQCSSHMQYVYSARVYFSRIIADGTVVDRTRPLSAIYTEYREPDYFLYLSYKEELRRENSM